MLSGILGFFVFTTLLFLASFIGACVRCAYEWIEYERVPSFGSRRALVLCLSQLLWYSVGIGILFIGVRYLVIPWFGLASLWAMLSIPVQFMIGWRLTQRFSQGEMMKEDAPRGPNARGEEVPNKEIRRADTPHWRKSEMKQITLPRQVRCFEKRPGGVLVRTMWSLHADVTITIGPLETVFWDHNFHEVAPFRYNGQIYYVLIHEIGIQGLVVKLRTRSKFSVVK